MSKKKTIALLTAAMLLCGCSGNTPTDTTQNTSSTTTTDTTTAQSADLFGSTEPTTAPTAEITDFAEEISDGFFKLDGFDYSPNSVVALDKKTLAVVYSKITPDMDYPSEGSFAAVLNLETGERKEIALTNELYDYPEGYAVNGHLAVMSASECKLTIYDKSLNKTCEHSFTENPDIWLSLYPTDEDTVAVQGFDNGKITLATVDDGGRLSLEEKELPEIEGHTISYIAGGIPDSKLAITASDENWKNRLFLWDTDSGETVGLNIDDPAKTMFFGDNIVYDDSKLGKISIYSKNEPNMVKSFSYPVGYNTVFTATVSGNKNIYFSRCDEENVSIKAYSLETGACVAETDISFPCGDIYRAAEFGESVCFGGGMNTESGVYLWTPEEKTPEKSDFPILTESDYGQLADELAQKIKDEYGIDVHYGTDGVAYFTGYAVVAETNERLIYSAMQTVERFCSKFPDGFFEELKNGYGSDGEISIYLTGRIIPDPNESESISDAAAFTFLENTNRRVLVVDIAGTDIEQTIAHEFMHAIESVITERDAWGYGEPLEAFERWPMLNPEGFEYVYAYTDENGETTGFGATDYVGSNYYEGGEMALDDVYFVDGYATSYMTEDIARIFEHIFISDTVPLPDYFASKNMQLKASYLCACIREAFDCMEGAEVCWEASLSSDYSLEYFKSNYDLDAYYANLYLNAAG